NNSGIPEKRLEPGNQLLLRGNHVHNILGHREKIARASTADGTLKEGADVNVAYRAIEEGPENLSSVNYSIGGTSFSSRKYVQSAFGYPPDHTLTLGEYSLLVMETFNISGGAMYTVTGMPRYAARELAFRNIIQGRAYPRMKLSGDRALRIIGRVLTLQEEGRLR
ncbi:MAG: hypothetical protein PF508_21215, partial [Spirochaeta sp.]|nr:hypothetical protein [Spirochaeta sp.]